MHRKNKIGGEHKISTSALGFKILHQSTTKKNSSQNKSLDLNNYAERSKKYVEQQTDQGIRGMANRPCKPITTKQNKQLHSNDQQQQHYDHSNNCILKNKGEY